MPRACARRPLFTMMPIGRSEEHSLQRCAWVTDDPLYREYHDVEWGVPVHDDRKLFEFLLLEGAQAGLSWITVLRKRAAYREAFANFDPVLIAAYSEARQNALLGNAGIIRNRLKIASAIGNARAFLSIQERHGSFDSFIWQFVGGQRIENNRRSITEIPSSTPQSDAISKTLRRAGFRFVGTTICYAFMQAVGMVNDHTVDCFRHRGI